MTCADFGTQEQRPCDPTHRRCLEESQPQRQKVHGGPRGRGCFVGTGSRWEDGMFQRRWWGLLHEIQMYLMPLNCTVKVVKMASLYILP